MRTTTRLCLVLAVVATAGLVAVPTVTAKSNKSGAWVSQLSDLEKNQNTGIRQAKRRAQRAHERIEAIKEFAFGLAANNNKQQTDIDAVNSTVAAIVAGVPTIVNGLTALQSGLVTIQGVLQNTVSPALTALSNGLTTVGAGLTTLGNAYQAVEYGVAKVFASGAATPTIAAGSSTISADVPDDGNSIQTNETAIIVAGATGQMDLNLRADIRSNESDNGVGATVGQAGAFMYVENLDTGVRVACGGATNPPGIFGTLPGDSIVTPSGTVTNLPLKNLPGGVARTDTTHPDGSSVSLFPAACSFGAAIGTTYAAHYSVNFVDIPTSLTPGGTE